MVPTAIVFFEVVGPVLTKRAIACTLEPEPAEARETDAACASRTILMPVSAALPPERLLNTIEAAGCDAGCWTRSISLCSSCRCLWHTRETRSR